MTKEINSKTKKPFVFKALEKPPCNVEIERNLISKMIASPGIIPFVVAKMRPIHFSYNSLYSVYTAIVTTYKKKARLDAVTIHNELLANEKERITTQHIQEIINLHSDAKGYKYDMEALDGLAKRRKAIYTMMEIAEDLYNTDADLIKAVNTGIDAFTEVKTDNVESKADLFEASDKFWDGIEEGRNKEGVYLGMETGIQKIDKALRGIAKGEILLIGARPSVGKTTIAINMLLGLAENGNKTFFFSMEQKVEQVYGKLLANKCKIDSSKFKQPKSLTEDELKCLKDTDDYLKRIDLKIDGTSGVTISDIEAVIIREKNTTGLDCIALDYLTIMGFDDIPHQYKANMNLTLTYVMKQLKNLAKKYNIAIIVLSQLSRSGNDRPSLTSFRESGSLEQEADIAVLLHAERDDKEQFVDDTVEFIVAKSRNDELGVINLTFDRPYQRIS